MTWSDHAACKGQTAVMYPTQHRHVGAQGGEIARRVAEARAVCASCPVTFQCREWGDSVEDASGRTWGVLGGETGEQRARRRGWPKSPKTT